MPEYDNPKPIAVHLQEVDAGRDMPGVLLIQRADNGGWAFPSGWIETGLDQSAETAAAREFSEETGIPVNPGRLFRSEITPASKIMLFVLSYRTISACVFDNWKPTPEALAIRIAHEPEELVFPTHTAAMVEWFDNERHF